MTSVWNIKGPDFGVLNNLNALSHDGRCKTLDAGADGYGRGEGFAALYMRPSFASSGAGAPVLRILGESRGAIIHSPRHLVMFTNVCTVKCTTCTHLWTFTPNVK